MISLRGLTKRFGSLVAVDHLSIELAKGEVVGLVDPDGAGKTTTLRMIAGLVDATEGSAVIAGFDVAKQPDEVRDRIGYMAQRFGLYGDLTVQENMHFYADLFGMTTAERKARSPKLLEMTRMTSGSFCGGWWPMA